MKRIFVLFFLLNSIITYSQKSLEGGLMLGGMYYLGDVNHGRQFHSVKPAAGLFFRQNLNKRWAVRANVVTGSLSASDQAFSSEYQKLRNYSFNTPALEVVAQAEFNFLSYKLGSPRHTSPFTPYLASGIGFLLTSNSLQAYNITLPISVGIKLAVSKKLEIGVEWSARKTFSDRIDNLSGSVYDVYALENESKSRYKQNASYYSKDWYVYSGLFITYKIFQSGGVCKAYDF
jgi:hypothetical protein